MAPAQIDALNARIPLWERHSDHNALTSEELQGAISKFWKTKAPGPDGVPSELLLLLDDANTLKLLDCYNAILERGDVPKEWKEATVISIYNSKGLDTDPFNYRPISFLSSFYKLFASMPQAC